MATLTKPQAIELFHLAMLQVLPQHMPPADYAVKGGANLRLFLGSVRRSEDIDFNFLGRSTWELQPRMNALMASPALASLLAVHGLRFDSINASKMTATTGRWKFVMSGPGVRFNSKIEFSMRQEDRPDLEMASVARELANAARMRPALANHYRPTGAVEQKVAALALRSETQARDVFDLDFLFTRFPAESAAAVLDAGEVDRARHRVFEATYEEYRELVVTFLDPAFVSMFASESEWDRMALHVSTRLDAVREAIS